MSLVKSVTLLLLSCSFSFGQVSEKDDLVFDSLATTWDEGLPMGNGMVGALVWQHGQNLRFSLDRADLWDLRPIKEFDLPQFRFSWVQEQVRKNDYKPVQDLFDLPYERDPGPTKIPAGALEFNLTDLGPIKSVRLGLKDAVTVVEWRGGTILHSFVHAIKPIGWFRFEHVPTALAPVIIPPAYAVNGDTSSGSVNSLNPSDLKRLGYSAPDVRTENNSIIYHQKCYGGLSYNVVVKWRKQDDSTLEGVWSVSSHDTSQLVTGDVRKETDDTFRQSYSGDFASHTKWWKNYWSQSWIQLPDSVLEKQWYREIYKFGSTSRRGSPPITLQAVWTADNGKLPPWKGDYHNDLNTQLSYWPAFSSNHLEEELSFLDWLWSNKPAFERYTKKYFGIEGLDVPGVCTLTGEPMGGWIQYSLSPTVSAWLSQHFYLQWRYSMDRIFLRERAYPWIREVALFLDGISVKGSDGKKKLPISSSPEINDNSVAAWFHETTNYDLALVRWLYTAASELAGELGKIDEAAKWHNILSEWSELAKSDDDGRLLVAPGYSLKESHRHFSHLIAIHPLGIVNWDNGESDRKTIKANIAELRRLGPDWWCGYSYSWFGSLAARARDGELASEALRTFAQCFCLPNGFHVNGDQSGTGKSKFTYRPFTLEGNFAFAEGIQEMLIQSQQGIVRVFPAVPWHWRNASFEHLRTEGALLVSAKRKDGRTTEVRLLPEVDGIVRLENPFGSNGFALTGGKLVDSRSLLKNANDIIEISTFRGKQVVLSAK